MKPYRATIIVVVVIAIASTAFTIVSPRILGNVTNNIFTGYVNRKFYDEVMSHLPAGTQLPPGTTAGAMIDKLPAGMIGNIPAAQRDTLRGLDLSRRPGIDYGAISEMILLLVGLYLISALFSFIQGRIMAGISEKVSFHLRRDIAEKINRLPLRYFDSRTHGEILSRVTNDVDTISQTLNQSLMQLVSAVTMLIGILVMMFTISWQMTIVALIVLPVSIRLIRLVVKRSQAHFVAQQVSLGKINSHVEEMFSGHNVIKAFNGEKHSIAKFKDINGGLYGSAWRAQFFSGLLMPVMNFVGNLGYVGVAVLGGWLAIRGKIRIGDIQAFIQYMNQFTQPITQAANTANVLQSTAAAAERVFEFLSEKEETAEEAIPAKIADVKGAVTFDNVVFGYTPDKTIIKGFTTQVNPGQKVAIVGPTGAGKTTIVNLLMRFYDVDSGAITIDGVNIRNMKRSGLRALFGMVLQDAWLFTGSIEENIAYGKNGATHTEVLAAAEAAHADHFIRALPGGYQMQLNEEADNISQGEKQLLTIARAMLADAPMLILDEATSSVDTRTELLIQQAMDKLMQGRTSFVIAHRLSTIKNADLILVMQDGNIVEQGKHDELLSRNGEYAALYNSQFAGAAV
ncbi:ABC transporter ATP-binding protein [Filimonas effusa]|uniref:ABC transporter ATP-binding protein n=2 Tax=Filimonas effusa TaxID=2508721 RepID=A0A4Q1DFH5_9BACT|nr:ABC transporter ATP-binding protein [Filimonas effusa]